MSEEIKMTKVEQDRQIVKGFPPFTGEEIEQITADLTKYLHERKDVKHFFLLSEEGRYYTIFRRVNILTPLEKVAQSMINFLLNDAYLKTLGGLKVFKRTETGEIEIWIGESFFLLFEAESFFVNL